MQTLHENFQADSAQKKLNAIMIAMKNLIRIDQTLMKIF